MSRFIRRARRDSTQAAIVEGLRAAGWYVFQIESPCDLLVFKPGRGFRTLECKPPKKLKSDAPRLRLKEQEKQAEFCQLTGTPYVVTPEQAIKAVECT